MYLLPLENTTPRAYLLAGVLRFVQAAARQPGVIRIALIGSLTTPKQHPKDADLLVTIADDIDLAPLARLGRQLSGYGQAAGLGGEVFLADPQGHYLGRICHWKECRFGIRLSCDAMHCGRREYLHDDLEELRLDDSLVTNPPLLLWPEIRAQVSIPADVERDLLAPLRLAVSSPSDSLQS